MYQESGLDIFINTSIKYVQLNAVRYETELEQLTLEIALGEKVAPERRRDFRKRLQPALALFFKLKREKAAYIEVEFKEYTNGITLLRYKRDINSVSEQEIGIFMGLMESEFGGILLKENALIPVEDDFKLQVKKSLMRKLKQSNNQTSSLLAYHEDGRVLVFNK